MICRINLKEMVGKGIYYLGTGRVDYPTWSDKMLDYYGPEIEPHMKDIRKWSIVIQNSDCAGKNSKLNCWQFMGCLLQKNEEMFRGQGESYKCPVLSEEKFDGIHEGINGGRVCWIVSNTFCCGTMQGTYDEKYQSCLSCDFYRLVAEEEEDDLKSRHELEKMFM